MKTLRYKKINKFDKTLRAFKYNLPKKPPIYNINNNPSNTHVLSLPKNYLISIPVPKSVPLFRKHQMNLRKRCTLEGLPLQNVMIEPPTFKKLLHKPLKNHNYVVYLLALDNH